MPSDRPPAGPGTTPRRIALSEPTLGPDASRCVQQCLDSGWVSSAGTFVERFERMIADHIGRVHAVATINGTAALHIALKLAGVERDDEVLVPALTFIAPANAVRYHGAWPVFIDAEPTHWQIDPAAVERFCAEQCQKRGPDLFNRDTGRRVRALLPVHLLGHPVPLRELRDLAMRFGLVLIEDAAEAIGARYAGRPVGHGSGLATLSFNGNKLITTGGGGMLLTADAQLADRARHLTTQAKVDPIESIHDTVGHNYRLSNLAAALGVAQMQQLDELVAARRRIAATYAEQLADVPGLSFMPEAPEARASCWLTTVLIDQAASGMTSRELLRTLGAAGIEARPLWQPLHRSPAFADGPNRDCPIADRLHAQALSLPSSAHLTEADQQRVIDTIRRAAR